MAFGDRLAAVRRGNGLTQEQFAEQLQVSRQAVSKWESGRGYPEMEKILISATAIRYPSPTCSPRRRRYPPRRRRHTPRRSRRPPPLPRATLGSAVGAFLTNLSPKTNGWLELCW